MTPDTTARQTPPRATGFPLPRNARPSPAGFELLGELGRGGMGVVYKARQTALNRVVALKMVLGGHYAIDADRLRFMAEAEAVASVKHPNVVQVFEFGYSDAQPYFAMEYLDGGSLARRLGEFGRMPAAAAAHLVEQIARGVQAAHDVGLIHRDLKPGNILLARARSSDSGVLGGRSGSRESPPPDSQVLVPKVTDFGLAKHVARADITLTGVVIGTPAYMAPEQATGHAKLVGPAADVYALGAILYECLSGRPPFTADDSGAILVRVASEDAAPVRTFAPDVPADLELICLKCLAKLPAERYRSAAALADDLNRFLTGEPVSVRPAGQLEKAVKWVRRYPTRAIAYGLTLLTAALIGLTAGAIKLWREADAAKRFAFGARDAAQGAKGDADAARADAVAARDQLAVLSAARAIDLAHRELEANNVVQARRLLDDCPPHLRPWEWRFIDLQGRRERAALKPDGTPQFGVAFTPDGRRVTFSGPKGVADWDPDAGDAGKPLTTVALALAVSGDGARFAVNGAGSIRVHDRGTGKLLRRIIDETDSLALNHDGSRVLFVGRQFVTVWDVARDAHLVHPTPEFTPTCVAYGPDDATFAVGGTPTAAAAGKFAPGVVKLWRPGRPPVILNVHNDYPVKSLAFDPAGKLLAAGCEDGTIVLRDLADPPNPRRLRGHTARAQSLAFSADGTRLASGSFDRTVRLWDAATGRSVFLWKGHSLAVTAVAVSPDGARVASASHDATVRLWDATAVPDGVLLAGVRSKENPLAVTVSDDGARVYVSAGVAPVQAFDARTGARVWKPEPPRGEFLPTIRLSPDGARLLGVTQLGQVREWDARTGDALPDGPAFNLPPLPRLSADLSRAVCRDTNALALNTYDTATGAKLAATARHIPGNNWPAISPDGRRVASLGVLDRAVRVWDTDTGAERFACEGHIGRPTAAAFSPDGARLASVADDGWIKLWDAATGRETLTLKCPTPKLVAVGFSPDGSKLVATDDQGVAYVRDAGPPR